VDNVPVGSGRLSVEIRRTAGRITASVRRTGDATPLEVVFSPALPLGANVSGKGVTAQPTPGDVHATVKATITDSADLGVAYTGGWSIEPPAMPTIIGRRSEAPRVLSERLGNDGRYVVSLEGMAGRSYQFRVRTPDAAAARGLVADVTSGAKAVVSETNAGRIVTIVFPSAGANSDGYTAATVSFSIGQR
jgi:hypothetical protein